MQGLPNFIELKRIDPENGVFQDIDFNIREAYCFWLCKFLILLIIFEIWFISRFIKWLHQMAKWLNVSKDKEKEPQLDRVLFYVFLQRW